MAPLKSSPAETATPWNRLPAQGRTGCAAGTRSGKANQRKQGPHKKLHEKGWWAIPATAFVSGKVWSGGFACRKADTSKKVTNGDWLHIGTDCSWNSSEGILKDFSLFAITLLCGVHATFCPATPAFACFTQEASDSWNPNTSIYHQSEHKSNRSFEEMTDTLLCFQIPLLDAISDSTLY